MLAETANTAQVSADEPESHPLVHLEQNVPPTAMSARHLPDCLLAQVRKPVLAGLVSPASSSVPPAFVLVHVLM